MPLAASYTGLGRDYPGFAATVQSAPDPALADHATHIGHLVEHWVGEHPDEHLSISVSGSIEGAQRLFTLNVATVARPTVPAPVSEEETPVDVTKSHDPLAPEGTDLSAEPAEEAPAAQEPAVADAVHQDDAPDVSAEAVESEAQDAPVPGETPGHPVDATTGEPLDLTEEQHAALAEVKLDPTSPAESAGPTEPEAVAEPEAEVSEADLAAKAVTSEPEPQPVDEHGEPIPTPPITEERGIDAAQRVADERAIDATLGPKPAAEDNPTTEGEVH